MITLLPDRGSEPLSSRTETDARTDERADTQDDTDNPVTVTKALIQKISVKVPLSAEPAPEVAKMQTEFVAVKTIYIYKDEMKKKLNLTKDIQDAPQQKVVSASTVSPDEHSQMVTTLLDAAAGES